MSSNSTSTISKLSFELTVPISTVKVASELSFVLTVPSSISSSNANPSTSSVLSIDTSTSLLRTTTSSTIITAGTSFSSTSTSFASTTATSGVSSLSSKTLSAAVIGGSIAGSLVFLLAVGAGIFLLLRRQRQTRHLLQACITPLERDLLPSDDEGPSDVGPGEKGRSLLKGFTYTQPSHRLQTIVPSVPSSQNHSRSEQQMMLEPEDDVRSQMASMKTAMARMLEHVRRIEAHIEEADLPPPSYISS